MTAKFENTFLKGMFPHHQMAIRMSQVALQNSEKAAVKDLAQRIIAGQTPEIQQMERFLAHNGVKGYRPALSRDDRMMLKELRSLRGTEFDRAFLTDMSGHHQAAISGGHGMIGASESLGRAAQPGLKQLCTNIVSAQTREIQEMQTLLEQAGARPRAVQRGRTTRRRPTGRFRFRHGPPPVRPAKPRWRPLLCD
jgi:uncharacterized protein (DUF305 family)